MAATIKQFFKENRKARKNEFFAASKQFTDDKGEALLWELRPLSRKKVEHIRTTSKNDSQFGLMLVTSSVVDPDLNNADLQDSYGVKKAEDLIDELLTPAEYYALLGKVLRMNELDKGLAELSEEAKN